MSTYFHIRFHFSRNSLASSTLDLEDDLIPTAPPIDASLLEIIPLRVYESRTNQILNAKGTLKKKQSTDLQFFLHEHEETVSDVDSVSLVSEEDFGGIKGHIKNGHMTIRSHRGKQTLIACSRMLMAMHFRYSLLDRTS